MPKQRREPLQAGDKVSHKGNLWIVQGESNGLVTVVRDGVRRVLRINQVRKEM